MMNDGANANRIEGNKIGTDATGSIDFGNVARGIELQLVSSFPTTNNIIGGTTIQQLGTGGDGPAVSDYDGDGRFDATVFRPTGSTWYVQRTTAGTLIQNFGITGDRPVPNAFVP
jgi:hypothetical protein